MWLLLTAVACSGSDDAGKDSETGADTSQDSGETGEDSGQDSDSGGDSGDTGPDVRPSIGDAEAWCYFHDIGETFWNWEARCTATDPQGTDTLGRAGTLTALQGGSEIATYALSCDNDTGVCSTAFREDYDDILCSQATSYTFRFVVMDEDDHTSAPVEVQGRAE